MTVSDDSADEAGPAAARTPARGKRKQAGAAAGDPAPAAKKSASAPKRAKAARAAPKKVLADKSNVAVGATPMMSPRTERLKRRHANLMQRSAAPQ